MELQLEKCKKCNGVGVVSEYPDAAFSNSIACPRCEGRQRVYVTDYPIYHPVVANNN